jgi:membrane protease YdiL (CAAX protease family)
VLLPRKEVRYGASARQLNAVLWGLFHLAFGPGNLLVLIPPLILVPLIVQRPRNIWLAVLLHAGLSGPGFVALALGFTL